MERGGKQRQGEPRKGEREVRCMDLSVNKEKGARCGVPEGADDRRDNDDGRYSDG